jgi:hypothetical protein
MYPIKERIFLFSLPIARLLYPTPLGFLLRRRFGGVDIVIPILASRAYIPTDRLQKSGTILDLSKRCLELRNSAYVLK